MSSQSNPQPRNVGTTSFGSVGSFFVSSTEIVRESASGTMATQLMSSSPSFSTSREIG